MLTMKRFLEGVWIDVPEKICPGGISLKIRPVHTKIYMELKESCKKKIWIPGKDENGEIVDDYDDAKFYWLMFCYMLEAWKGIEVEGTIIDDEIREAIYNLPGITKFISETARQLLADEEQKLQEELKNSVRSQNG